VHERGSGGPASWTADHADTITENGVRNCLPGDEPIKVIYNDIGGNAGDGIDLKGRRFGR